MFLPALVFMCRTMHRLARARPGSSLHRADVQSAVVAWVLLPTTFLWCLSSPYAQSSGYYEALGGITLAAFAALLVALLLVGLKWASVAQEARRWRRGESPSRPGQDFGLGDDWIRVVPPDGPYRAAEQVEVLASGSPAAATAALGWNVAALLAVAVAMSAVMWLTLAAQEQQQGMIGCPHAGCHRIDSEAHGFAL